MKKFSDFLEAAGVYLAYIVFRCLPAPMASDLGGWIGRAVGPKLGASRKALNNLRAIMPEKTAEEHTAIIRDMWDNLGRTIAEYPHLETIALRHTEFSGGEFLAIPADKPFVLFSGHLANWEAGALSFYKKAGKDVHLVYRPPNNPHVATLLNHCRSLGGKLATLPKSRSGTRAMVETLGDKKPLLILIDQKYNEGIAAPFLGKPAMTSEAFVRFAQKFACPLIPYRTERLRGCQFRVSVFPPLTTEGREIEDVIAEAHGMLESWIRERPGQWLWLHRRWDSRVLGG